MVLLAQHLPMVVGVVEVGNDWRYNPLSARRCIYIRESVYNRQTKKEPVDYLVVNDAANASEPQEVPGV